MSELLSGQSEWKKGCRNGGLKIEEGGGGGWQRDQARACLRNQAATGVPGPRQGPEVDSCPDIESPKQAGRAA